MVWSYSTTDHSGLLVLYPAHHTDTQPYCTAPIGTIVSQIKIWTPETSLALYNGLPSLKHYLKDYNMFETTDLQ